MSIKLERIESNYVKTISEIIVSEVNNRIIQSITVTDCKITNDLSFAKVYFTTYKDKAEVTKELNKTAGFIRTKLAERINLRHTPKLIFVFDESIEYANKIEQIINDIKK